MSNFLIEKPKCVFIHIPKTGGGSIRHGFFNNRYRGPLFGRIDEKWKQYFSFAFTRHPYDRLVSAWLMFTEGMATRNGGRMKAPEDARGLSLREFLEIVVDGSIGYDYKVRRRPAKIRIRHHTIPQTHPYNCLDEADFVGRFENLQEDFDEVVRTLGLESRKLPYFHTTSRDSHYMDYYCDETLQIARDYYREDFDKLGYDDAR